MSPGYAVLFVSTHKLLAHLNGGRADGSYDRRLQAYLRPDLFILDDFGLKPVGSPGPGDLLDVILERYERGSILFTSNRAPSEWPDLFGDPLMASAALDRLADRAHVVVITGPATAPVTARPCASAPRSEGWPEEFWAKFAAPNLMSFRFRASVAAGNATGQNCGHQPCPATLALPRRSGRSPP